MQGEFNFHFSFGDSGQGPIGMCARVWAKSKAEALKKLQEALPEKIEVKGFVDSTSIEYVNVYLGVENITVADIDEVEDADGNNVDYVTTCPHCGAPDALVVVEANGVAMHSRLEMDGFEVPDEAANDAANSDYSTEDEKVECEECGEAVDFATVLV